MSECPCCQGRRYVRLALYRPAKVVYGDGVLPPEAGEVAYKDYACPECKADTVAFSKVVTLTEVDRVLDGYGDNIETILRSGIAMQLARQMLDKNLIEFRRGPSDGLVTPFGGIVNVVSKEASATLEQRVAARQEEVAREVVAEVTADIQNWGSASRYLDGRIEKHQAYQFMREALERVLERRKA